MAKERWFTGFEDANGYDLSSISSGAIVATGTARTGDFMFSVYTPTGAVRQARRSLINSYTTPNDGDRVIARMQVAVRVRMRPTSGSIQLFGFSIGTTVAPNLDARVYLDSAGLVSVEGAASYGTMPVASVFTPALDVWYVLRLDFRWTRNNAGSDPVSATLEAYLGSSIDSEDPVAVGTGVSSASISLGGFNLAGTPCLGSNVSAVRIVDFDDWWLSVADGADAGATPTADLNWPTGSRIQRIPITGQSVGNWTGDYKLATDTPNSGIAGNEQTTTTAGQVSTFTHPTAAELGLIPPSQLAVGGSEEEQEEAPPFTGLPIPDGGGGYETVSPGSQPYVTPAQDLTLPVPVLRSFLLQPGAGQFNNGVWIRLFTVEWRSHEGPPMQAHVGPLSQAYFLSATAAPNFAARIDVGFAASTPADRFIDPTNPGTSHYRRYGLGVLVTNAYNASGLFNPFSSGRNTTGMDTFGGPGGIDAGPFDSFVNLIGVVTPNGTQPPYANTNPSNRPTNVVFNLVSPRGGVVSNLPFGNVFQAPIELAAGESELPIAAAIKVTCAFQLAAGSHNDDILLDGVATSVATNTSFGGSTQSQFALGFGGWTSEQFDAMVFGARAGAGLATTLRLGQCIAEVITAGPCTRRTPGNGQYQHKAGIYTSNNGLQTIDVGFVDAEGNPLTPSAVMVKRIGTAATPGAFKAWWMGGTQSWAIDTVTPESIGIMELVPGGFKVGPAASANGIAATYAYLAIFDGGEDTINDSYFVTGNYQRQSPSDPDNIVELAVNSLFSSSWTPDVVMVFGDSTYLRTPDHTGLNSDNFATTGLVTDGIIGLGDGTITIGNNSLISNVGQYPFFAYKFDAGGLLEDVFDYGAFAGTGGTLNIPTNFRNELTVLDHPAGGYQGRFRSDQGNTGNNSVPWIGGAVTTTDITAINNTSFDVGTGASVVGQTSYWLAWIIEGRIGNTGHSDLPPPDGGGGPPPGEPGGGEPPVSPGIDDPEGPEDPGTPFEMENAASRALRLANLCTRVLHRLGDSDRKIWDEPEIDGYLRQAALQIAVMVRLVWDQAYLEDVPPGFHCTSEFERGLLEFGFQYGVASCNHEWELEYGENAGLWTADDTRFANHTSPADLLHIVAAGAYITGEPTLPVPVPLVEIERAAWDQRTMDAVAPRHMMDWDSRFELTQGEVIAYTWRKDGNRMLRKIRVPNQLPTLMTTDGTWGIARNVADASLTSMSGTWGIPRRIEGWHPIGSTVGYGTPRRFYYDQINVKIEFWRKFEVECRLSNLVDGQIQRYAGELPRRYFMYMADYCQWRALIRQGPGQDYKMAQLYKDRWERNLGRLYERVQRRDQERVYRAGGNDPSPRGKPPRPRLPWQYGSKVR